MSDKDKALKIVRHVQRRIFHDQLTQPPTSDPKEILRVGSGRCGHVVNVLSHLLDSKNIRNRVIHLPNHVLIEAHWNGKWHLLDADVFKHGVIPMRVDGFISSLRDVQGNHFIDRFPPTMYVYTRDYFRYLFESHENLLPPHFYEPHEAGFMSYYFQMNVGLPKSYPPSRPRNLKAEVDGRKVKLSWSPSTDKDGDLTGYEIMVSKKSRGWNYFYPTYNRVPENTSEVFMVTERPRFVYREYEKGRHYWSVRAVDEHRKLEPDTYYFPSEEKMFVVK